MTIARTLQSPRGYNGTVTKQSGILIADDDAQMHDIVRLLFEHDPIDVLSAVNGASALRLWQEKMPDVVLLDVRMPDMDGFEICRRIRMVAPELPIIFITAYADRDYIRCGYQLGAYNYIVKPIEDLVGLRYYLLNVLEHIQRRHSRLREVYRIVRDNQLRVRSRDLHEAIVMMEHDLGIIRKGRA